MLKTAKLEEVCTAFRFEKRNFNSILCFVFALAVTDAIIMFSVSDSLFNYMSKLSLITFMMLQCFFVSKERLLNFFTGTLINCLYMALLVGAYVSRTYALPIDHLDIELSGIAEYVFLIMFMFFGIIKLIALEWLMLPKEPLRGKLV